MGVVTQIALRFYLSDNTRDNVRRLCLLTFPLIPAMALPLTRKQDQNKTKNRTKQDQK